MERRTIATPHGPVPVAVAGSQGRGTGILLAHGAGAGQRHPWMGAMREALVDVGFRVMTFDYAYIAAGRKAPDRMPKLLDVHEAVFDAFASSTEGVVLAGKSMGGRVGGHLVAERSVPAAGLVYFGYPLVAMGRTEPRATDHLDGVAIPQLFISGDRDRMGPADLIADVARAVPNGRFVPVASGDHSLVPLKATGRTLDEVIADVAGVVDAWVREEVEGQAVGGT